MITLSTLLILCTFAAIFFDILANYPFIYALLFFFPIVLAAMWYNRKAVYVAIFLGLVNIISALIPFYPGILPLNEVLSMVVFIVIAFILGDMNEKRDKVFKQLRKLSTAILQQSDPVFITDVKGNIEFVNPAFEKLTGYSAEEVIGKTPRILKSGKYRNEYYNTMWNGILSGKVFSSEVINKRKDSSLYIVERTITPIIDGDGTITHFIATGKDITDRKRLEQQIMNTLQNLEDQVKERTREVLQSEKMAALGVLVAGVAHEVNNPLAFIKANSEIMQEDLTKIRANPGSIDVKQLDEVLELVKVNRDGIDRIETITKALKRVARQDTGEKALADINQGIKDTLVLLRNQMKHKVQIHEEYGDIPSILCNIGQLNQVFINLMNNSMEAMKTGDIWIKTWASDGNVYISFRDDGSGIPPENLGKIFDAFFTTKAMGTGLGLTISYSIIKDHGGDIKVKSEVGKGTTMTINIPISH